MTLRSAIPFSQWYVFVYATNSSVTSLEACGGKCYLDTTTPCHFYIYKENTCYLGDFHQDNSLVESSTATADVYLNRGEKK